MKERLTTYHCGKAVIKDKNKLSEAHFSKADYLRCTERRYRLCMPFMR